MDAKSVATIDAHPRRIVIFLLTICLSLRLLQLISILNDRMIRQIVASHSLAFAIDGTTTLVEAVLIGLAGFYFLGRPHRAAKAALARSERRYRCLAEDSADLIVVFDRSSSDLAMATAIIEFLGYKPDDLQSRSLLSFVHQDDRPIIRLALASLSDAEPRQAKTLRMIHASGEIVWVDAKLRRVDHGAGRVETIVTIRDVTARQREAEELREATLLAQRAKAEAEEANKAKTEFLACMSHEIRTPLHSVIGFASLILNQREVPQDVRLYGERIQASGKALLTVVNDILDFSRVESGAFELKRQPFLLFHLIDECLSIVRKEATARALSLHVEIRDTLPKVVVGDEARLRQILLNLLYNAIKFTPDGSVCLEVGYDRAGPGFESVRFAVVDTGIGIAKEDVPRLFQRFIQVDGSMKRTYGGAGLGLAISKSLVELMGGMIGVDSARGVGSTFWIAVPLPRSDAIIGECAPAMVRTKDVRRILLVEDVRLNQELIRTMLRSGNHWVDVVGNGAEAVMAVRDCRYDLVLMDVQMPFMDGLTATRMIRALPDSCCDVPIVAMTANVLPKQTEMAREAGMNDVLLKPFTLAELDALLDRLGRVVASRRPGLDEPQTITKLEALIGAPKLRELLGNLAASIEQRFLASDPAGTDRAAIRRHAHASIAGCGMLGFTAFAQRCRELEHCDDAEFEAVFAILRQDAASVCAAARELTHPSAETPRVASAA